MSDPLLPVPDPGDDQPGQEEPEYDDASYEYPAGPGDEAGEPRGEEEFEQVESDPQPDVLRGAPDGGDEDPVPDGERAPAFRTPVAGEGLSERGLAQDLKDE